MTTLAIGGPRSDIAPGPGARLNPNHPLSNGLIVCCPTPLYDVARGNIVTPNGALPVGETSVGSGVTLTTGNRLDVGDDVRQHSLLGITIVGWGQPTGDLVIASRDRVTPSPNWGLYLYTSSGFVIMGSRGSLAQPQAAGSGVTNGRTYMFGGTATENSTLAYLNGAQVGSDTTTSGPLDDSTNPFTFGYVPWITGSSTGILGPVMIWNRVLNPGEMQALYLNPFAMVQSA